ncbi:hypothetical protein ACQ4PT_060137 [Festuca glaucescens]
MPADIQRLRRMRRIPDGVECRLPATEIAPVLEPGERVVFVTHFDRGFGLPASNFFRSFLDFFGLQPHHLPANAYLSLSCYATFCEGYAGLWPDVDFWCRLFFLKAQTTDGELRTCGAASLYPRRDVPFPKIPTSESVKKWQTTFFYVENVNLAKDLINLPAYSSAPPTAKLNWGHDSKSNDPAAEVNRLMERLRDCITQQGLTATDLIAAFVSWQVLPLQKRVHKICYMSGRLDPTRTSKIELSSGGVARQVNAISQAHMPDNWQWGMEPYKRDNPPPLDFPRMVEEDGPLEAKEWGADLASSENEVDQAAGEDENPDAGADAGAAGASRGESAPPHPLRDLADDDEVVILEPLVVTPLSVAPLAASHVPLVRKRKVATRQSEASGPAPKKSARQRKVPGLHHQVLQGRREQLAGWHDVAAASTAKDEEGADSHAYGFLLPSVVPGASSSAPPTSGGGDGGQSDAPADGAGLGQTETPPPEPARASEPVVQITPPPASEQAAAKTPLLSPSKLVEPGVKAKLKAKVVPAERRPQQQQLSLHVGPAAPQLANVTSSADSSLGSVGAMEKEWRDSDQNEVTSRDGQTGVASMELFFSDMRALMAAASKESANRLNRTEKVISTVSDRRTALYNKVVASYHKAKTECSALARELEIAQAIKVKALEEELERLRKKESEHQAELLSVKQAEQEKVDGLNRKLGEVDEKCQRLSSEVTKQSTLLTETARRWTEDISRLDRGLAASFPETQATALEAARLMREERRAAGEEGSPYFSMEEHLAAMQARVAPITMMGHELRLAAEEIYRLLWPTEILPAELGRLVEWLNTAPDRIQDWKESSARAGADMALSFVLSWYEEVSLD